MHSEGGLGVFHDGSPIREGHAGGIEAQSLGAAVVAVALTPQALSGSADSRSLGSIHASKPSGPGARAPKADFHHDYQRPIPRHEIELEVAQAQVLCDDLVATAA